MAANHRVLALDVGERRVGTATANTIAKLPSPFKTIINSDSIYSDIKTIMDTEAIDILVIGLPRNLNGEETDQTRYVREFKNKLESIISQPIYFEDEALSSSRAKQALNHKKKDYKKEEVDSLAACYILDDFLANNQEIQNA